MPSFKNPIALERAINKELMKSVNAAAIKAEQVIDNTLKKFYGEYSPTFTMRTGQILKSLVRETVTQSNKGAYKASVYFDLSALHHADSYEGKTGITIDSDIAEKDILEGVMVSGYHGGKWSGGYRNGRWETGKTGTSKGTAVWTESVAELDATLIEYLKNELISNGIPVR